MASALPFASMAICGRKVLPASSVSIVDTALPVTAGGVAIRIDAEVRAVMLRPHGQRVAARIDRELRRACSPGLEGKRRSPVSAGRSDVGRMLSRAPSDCPRPPAHCRSDRSQPADRQSRPVIRIDEPRCTPAAHSEAIRRHAIHAVESKPHSDGVARRIDRDLRLHRDCSQPRWLPLCPRCSGRVSIRPNRAPRYLSPHRQRIASCVDRNPRVGRSAGFSFDGLGGSPAAAGHIATGRDTRARDVGVRPHCHRVAVGIECDLRIAALLVASGAMLGSGTLVCQ